MKEKTIFKIIDLEEFTEIGLIVMNYLSDLKKIGQN